MEVLFFKLILVLSNLSLLLYLLGLMIYHYHSHFNVKSWAFIFHFISFFWLLIRGTFWISTMTSLMQWTTLSFYLLYYLPNPLEFSSYMVLPLFFAQILYPQEWDKYWKYCRYIYFGAIVGIVLFQICLSWMKAPLLDSCNSKYDDDLHEYCFRTEDYSSTFRAITCVCFLFLTFIQCAFGLKIVELDKQKYQQYFSTPKDVMSIVNIILIFSFGSRAIYETLAMTKLFTLPNFPVEGDEDVPIIIFLLIELWVYIPVTLIIATITSRTFGSTSIASNSKNEFMQKYYSYQEFPITKSVSEEFFEVPSLEDGGDYEYSEAYHATTDIPIEDPSNSINNSDPYLKPPSLRNGSYLIESDSQREWLKNQTSEHKDSHDVVKLSNYFEKQRRRGNSMESESSSMDNHPSFLRSGSEQSSRNPSIHKGFSKRNNNEYELQVEPSRVTKNALLGTKDRLPIQEDPNYSNRLVTQSLSERTPLLKSELSFKVRPSSLPSNTNSPSRTNVVSNPNNMHSSPSMPSLHSSAFNHDFFGQQVNPVYPRPTRPTGNQMNPRLLMQSSLESVLSQTENHDPSTNPDSPEVIYSTSLTFTRPSGAPRLTPDSNLPSHIS